LGRNLRNLKEFEELSKALTKWLMLLRVLVLTEPGCPRYTAVKWLLLLTASSLHLAAPQSGWVISAEWVKFGVALCCAGAAS